MITRREFRVSTYLDLNELADDLAMSLSFDELIHFLTLVDAERADVDFTILLVKKLGEALLEEGFTVTIEETQ